MRCCWGRLLKLRLPLPCRFCFLKRQGGHTISLCQRRPSYPQQHCLHFITFSRYQRRKFLDTAAAREIFEDELLFLCPLFARERKWQVTTFASGLCELTWEKRMVGTGRFELPTPRTPSECSTRLSHVPTGGRSAALSAVEGLQNDFTLPRLSRAHWGRPSRESETLQPC
jgi:hypothetical protein